LIVPQQYTCEETKKQFYSSRVHKATETQFYNTDLMDLFIIDNMMYQYIAMFPLKKLQDGIRCDKEFAILFQYSTP
jgi:hypothetical protein